MLGELELVRNRSLACCREAVVRPRGDRRRERRHAVKQLGSQLPDAGARGARGGEHGHVGPEAGRPLRDRLGDALRRDQVGLGEHEDAGQASEALVVGGQLALDRGVIGERVGALAGG